MVVKLIMQNIASIVKVSLIGVMVFLTGCVSAQRDSGGAPMKLSAPKDILPWESEFNSFILLNPSSTYKITKKLRDNGKGITERITGNGLTIDIQYIVPSWFSNRTKRRLEDKDVFEKRLGQEISAFDIKAFPPSVSGPFGFFAQGSRCDAAIFSKRLKALTNFHNDALAPDAVIFLRACGTVKSTFDVQAFAKGIKLLKSDQKAYLKEKFAHLSARLEAKKAKRKADAMMVQGDFSLGGKWGEGASNIEGQFIVPSTDAQKGSVHLKVKRTDISCQGEWVKTNDPDSTAILPQGKWQVKCNDGSTAKGAFFAHNNLGHGTIKGLDSNKFYINGFYYR
jgi:hypothetical protein